MPFSFEVMADEERKKEERKKEEIYLWSNFETPTKLTETLHLISEGLLDAKLKTWLQEHFLRPLILHNVQDAILNTGHSYLAKHYCIG